MKLFIVALLCFVASIYCSSHSEAPGSTKLGNADPTDFYMFQSYEPSRIANNAFTTFIANWIPLQVPVGGPNYYSFSDDFYFEMYIDNDGDCRENQVFQWYFSNEIGGPQTQILPDSPLDFNFDCQAYQVFNETNAGGLTVTSNGNAVPVALKVIGAIKAGQSNAGSLNWNEYYYFNFIPGLRNDTAHPITWGSPGTQRFVKPFDYAGEKTFPDPDANTNGYELYAEQYFYDINIPFCSTKGRAFVGQRQESFSINLGQIFDLVNIIPVVGVPDAITNEDKNNVLSGFNTGSFVTEVPTSCLTAGGSNIIGSWIGLRQLLHKININGALTGHFPGNQMSRLGSPLVNELVIGLREKAFFNRGEPFEDTVNGFGFYVFFPSFTEILNLLFLKAVNDGLGINLASLAPTLSPRTDLVAIFLTGVSAIGTNAGGSLPCEMLRLNTATSPVDIDTQDPLGVLGGDVAGYPNGRRPGDDIVDITLMVVLGAFCYVPSNGICTATDAPAGGVTVLDGSPISAKDFLNAFPYLNTPNAGGFLAGVAAASTFVVPSIVMVLVALVALLVL